MYGGPPLITTLPATGVGIMAVATNTGQDALLSLGIMVLAIWTLIAAARAVLRMLPKHEV